MGTALCRECSLAFSDVFTSFSGDVSTLESRIIFFLGFHIDVKFQYPSAMHAAFFLLVVAVFFC